MIREIKTLIHILEFASCHLKSPLVAYNKESESLQILAAYLSSSEYMARAQAAISKGQLGTARGSYDMVLRATMPVRHLLLSRTSDIDDDFGLELDSRIAQAKYALADIKTKLIESAKVSEDDLLQSASDRDEYDDLFERKKVYWG